MGKILVIARREYQAAIRTKAFWIGILIMPIMMGGGLIVHRLLDKRIDKEAKTYAIIDRSPGGRLAVILLEKNKERKEEPPFVLELIEPAGNTLEAVQQQRLELSNQVRQGRLYGFLEIGKDVYEPYVGPIPVRDEDDQNKLEVIKENEPKLIRYQTNHPAHRDFYRWAERIVSAEVQKKRATDANVTPQVALGIVRPVYVLPKALSKENPQTGAYEEGEDASPVVEVLLPMALPMLMFMLMWVGATPLLQGVIEEKMQRISEVLLGSVQPFQLLMGKLIGLGCVSLTLAAIYLAGIYGTVKYFGYSEYVPPHLIAWFLILLVPMIFLFGSLFAAVGAACTDMKEAQSLLTPITLVAVLPMFVWMQMIQEPNSSFAVWASMVPFATPVLMMARMAVPPGIPIWQPILGCILMLLTTVLCVYAAGRIFRVGILMQGKGAKFGDLVRWAIKG